MWSKDLGITCPVVEFCKCEPRKLSKCLSRLLVKAGQNHFTALCTISGIHCVIEQELTQITFPAAKVFETSAKQEHGGDKINFKFDVQLPSASKILQSLKYIITIRFQYPFKNFED